MASFKNIIIYSTLLLKHNYCIHAGINITFLSEQFDSAVVTVDFEWVAQGSRLRSYDLIITPQPAFTFRRAEGVQLQVFYNTVYNVSVVGTSLICRKNVTTLIGLYYSEYYDNNVGLL